METLELPVVEEEVEQNTPWLDHDVDIAAFQLWRDASKLDELPDQEPQPEE